MRGGPLSGHTGKHLLVLSFTGFDPLQRWGPGIRVPAIIVSPYAKRRFVDHTSYQTVSILKLIETRWDLVPLGPRDAAANNLLNAFDFSRNP
jgi:phospholipase C